MEYVVSSKTFFYLNKRTFMAKKYNITITKNIFYVRSPQSLKSIDYKI